MRAALLETLRDRLGALQANDDAGMDQMSGRVRLQTLVLLRWIAIVGQLLAILFVHFGLNFRLPLLPADHQPDALEAAGCDPRGIRLSPGQPFPPAGQRLP